jgi:ribosomal protein S18 acetylase RimI-like enzyme
MSGEYSLIYKESCSLEEENILLEGVCAEARAQGMGKILPFSFFIKDENGKICGGVKGTSLYGSLYIDLLWVDRSLRNQGWGSKLMKEAERLGKERNCTFAVVHTMSWEALPFYQKLGYEVEFARKGYEKNSQMFVLRKSLT